jgi:hypothetical protein
LSLYGLETGARIAERRMPDYIDYLRFSEKGDRLLVLTAHQFRLRARRKEDDRIVPARG